MKPALKIKLYDGGVIDIVYIANDDEPIIVKVGYEAPVLVAPIGELEEWRETVTGLCIYTVPIAVAMRWPIEDADTLEERVIAHAKDLAIQRGMHLEPFNDHATFTVVIDENNCLNVYLHYYQNEE